MNTPITQLPDGSACFTATIMSKEEAMRFPPRERPICYRLSSEIYHAVWESVGAATVSKNPEEMEKVAMDLLFKIANNLEGSNHQRWLSVDEELPGEKSWVLHTYVGVRMPEYGLFQNGRFWRDNGPESFPATHWLPVPCIEAK